MIFHLIFSWSSFLSWLFFVGDMALIAFLTLRAYRDAEILDRYANSPPHIFSKDGVLTLLCHLPTGSRSHSLAG